MPVDNVRGRTFGDYELLDELGRGGMGVVYQAREPRLERDVALKILPKRLSGRPRLVEQFLREARASAGLSHPGIAPVYAVGEVDDVYYIAMEYVRGRTLAQLVDEAGPLPVERALDILQDAAEALHEAHAHGIIHRDVKPSNIMIDPRGRTRVVDFGLAVVADRARELANDEPPLGTPAFMAPEQWESDQVDVRCDVYSLGATLYVMLTGSMPFGGSDGTSQLCEAVLDPIPDPLKLRANLPEDVCRLLRNMVAEDPESRYDSMDAVIEEVDAVRAARDAHSAAADAGPKRQVGYRSLILAAAAVTALAVAGWLWRDGRLDTPSSGPHAQQAGAALQDASARPASVPLGPPEGLAVYWSFDEGSGTTARDSVGGNEGMLGSVRWTDGVNGGALLFSGDGASFVDVPHSESIAPRDAVTFTAWIKTNDFPNTFACVLYKSCGEPEAGARDRAYSFWVVGERAQNAGYSAHFTSTADGAEKQTRVYCPDGLFDLGAFNHVAGVVDPDNRQLVLYVNGRQAAITVYRGTNIRVGEAPLRIGGVYGPDIAIGPNQSGFSGVLDELRIYNRALTPEEIRADMNLVRKRPATALLAQQR